MYDVGEVDVDDVADVADVDDVDDVDGEFQWSWGRWWISVKLMKLM
jgi:hypothetical protein